MFLEALNQMNPIQTCRALQIFKNIFDDLRHPKSSHAFVACISRLEYALDL